MKDSTHIPPPSPLAIVAAHVSRWSPGRLALVLGVAVTLIKLPILFTTLGEQDQGRLLLDAVVYVTYGADTPRVYGLYTSPLWTLSFAAIAALFGTAHLVIIANVLGWLSGVAITAFSFLLLHELGARRGWAIAGAIAAGLVPGTYYMSLYGYPSQFALLFVPLSAWAFVRFCKVDVSGWRWLVLSGVSFTLLVLAKIDFAIIGTALFAVALVSGRMSVRAAAGLAGIVVTSAAAAILVTYAAVDDVGLFAFLNRVGKTYPWRSTKLFASPSMTVVYSCGLATLVLLFAATVWGMVRRASRADVWRDFVGWALAALPMWLFWVARPPMSNRHAVPGVLLTVLFAALITSRWWRSTTAPMIWLLLLVFGNWQFGQPRIDFNYRPSGNLAETVRLNKRAFGVAAAIARDVAEDPAPEKILVGGANRRVLEGIDLLPFVLTAMAERSARVEVDSTRIITFITEDGDSTRVQAHVSRGRATQLQSPEATYFSIYGASLGRLADQGKRTVRMDPNQRFRDAVK